MAGGAIESLGNIQSLKNTAKPNIGPLNRGWKHFIPTGEISRTFGVLSGIHIFSYVSLVFFSFNEYHFNLISNMNIILYYGKWNMNIK